MYVKPSNIPHNLTAQSVSVGSRAWLHMLYMWYGSESIIFWQLYTELK